MGALGTMQTDTNPTTQPAVPTASAASTVGTARSTLEATAPGQVRVIKRNGTVVPYDESKIAVAITKAFLAVEGGTAAASSRIRELIARNAEQVTATFERRMPSGGTIHIEEIQDQVELVLMRSLQGRACAGTGSRRSCEPHRGTGERADQRHARRWHCGPARPRTDRDARRRGMCRA